MSYSELSYTLPSDFTIDYGSELEDEIKLLCQEINRSPWATRYPTRWLAVKLLEQDHDIQAKLMLMESGHALLAKVEESLARLETIYGEEVDVMIASQRYAWIHQLVGKVVQKPHSDAVTLSDKIDQIVTHRIFGLPIFLLMMWGLFKLTTDVSAPYLDWIDGVINGPITNWVVSLLGMIGLGGSWLESLLVDGIIAGVGGVLVFVPVLSSLYLGLAILEESGYMGRAAFVMDRLMNTIGLQGKSFLPMLVGFGCTVPAIYATRTLNNKSDRILTGLLVPFMSCSARLPVYILFAAIFFPQNAGLVVFGLYLLGILTAIVLGVILKKSLFKGQELSTFVMELPPYRLPTLKGIYKYIWERTASFIHNASTLILATSVVIWLLMAIPVSGEGSFANSDLDQSAFARLSGAISPVLKPLGFGSWQASAALLTGFVAKEVVVSTMAQTHGIEEAQNVATEPTTFLEDVGQIGFTFVEATVDTIKSVPLIVGINLFEVQEADVQSDLMLAIQQNFERSSGGHGALAGLAFMVFVLIYTPCVAAVAAEKQELGTKWMWVSLIGQLFLAWLMAAAVFQGGKLLGL